MSAAITRLADWKKLPIKKQTKAAAENGYTAGDDPHRKEKNQEKQEAKVDAFIKASSKEYARLSKLTDKKGDYTEKDMGVMLKTMLKMTLKMLPQAQQTYVRWPSNLNAAAYNHLVSQGREISNDLRSIQDLTAQFNMIMGEVSKSVQLMLRNLVDQSYPLIKELQDSSPKTAKKTKRLVNLLLREHASYVSDSLKGLDARLNAYLVDRK